MLIHIIHMDEPSRGSSVSIVTGPRTGQPGFHCQHEQGRYFSLCHRVQTGSGAHSASYPMGTAALSPGIKRPGREAEYSPPSSAEVKNA
jgi:hypothetical protein